MQESQSNQESHKKSNDNQRPNQIIQSLTSKTRFFELFIENKNLIIQGLYLLKSVKTWLDRRTLRRIVVVTTDRHGLRRPILVQFLLLISSLPSTASMTNRHRHNGPSSVFVPKHFNSWNLGTGLLLWTSWWTCRMDRHRYDGPSQAA